MHSQTRSRGILSYLLGLALTCFAGVGGAQAQGTPKAPASAPATVAAPAAAPTAIDPVSACASLVEAEQKGRPTKGAELPEETQKFVRYYVDQVQVCHAFVAKSEEPCKSLPTKARQNECKSMLAKTREIYSQPPEKLARALFAGGIYNMLTRAGGETPKVSEAESRAIERAVRDGDPKGCAAVKAADLKRFCTAWALGDPDKCAPQDGESCTGPANGARQVAAQGMAAIQLPDAESKLLHEIALGQSTAGCDQLIELVKTDCVTRIQQAASATAVPTAAGAAAAGSTPGGPSGGAEFSTPPGGASTPPGGAGPTPPPAAPAAAGETPAP